MHIEKTNHINSTPLVSIVTVSYNSAKTIEETILSIINQTYKNIEYIIIDGNSTDGTQDIIRKYLQNIAYFTSEPDKGMYDALRKGFTKATGQICAYINSDDLYPNNAINDVVTAFTKNPHVLWLKGLDVVYDKNSKITYRHLPPVIFNNLLKKGAYLGSYNQWIQQETIFWRRELNNTIDWNKFSSFKLAGDYFMWCCFSNKTSLYILPKYIGGFRRHAGQLSCNFSQYKKEVESFTVPPQLMDKIKNYIYGKLFQKLGSTHAYKFLFNKRFV